jgi:pyrroloquinoline quinone biosynthesis protein B
VKVVLLGTAAGGGVPQWNCACRLCAAAQRGGPNVLPRTQDCLAVSATGDHWYLVNASPDIRTQIVGQPLLAPGPVRGALLTDAELDHTIGLLSLREGAVRWPPLPGVSVATREGRPHAAIRVRLVITARPSGGPMYVTT